MTPGLAVASFAAMAVRDPEPEQIDLRDLVLRLEARLGSHPLGYLRGKAAFRDAVAELVGCSLMEAEDLVDTLEAQGYVRYVGDAAAPSDAEGGWAVDLEPG